MIEGNPGNKWRKASTRCRNGKSLGETMASKHRKRRCAKSLGKAGRQEKKKRKGKEISSSYSDDWPTNTSANAVCQPPMSEERMAKKRDEKTHRQVQMSENIETKHKNRNIENIARN
jgi:hypothetical protein